MVRNLPLKIKSKDEMVNHLEQQIKFLELDHMLRKSEVHPIIKNKKHIHKNNNRLQK